MDDVRKYAIWEAYFEADFRQRYFLTLKGRIQKRLGMLSLSVALLSCGPIANFVWQVGYGWLLAFSGVLAGLLGVYIAASGISRTLAVATQAAIIWGQVAKRRHQTWIDAQTDADVWDRYKASQSEVEWIDAMVTEHLGIDDRLRERSWAETTRALAPAAG